MKKLLSLNLLIILTLCLTSCSKDEENDPQDTIDPQITISSPATSVSVSPGDEVSFDILFADDKALKSLSITSSELDINISDEIDGLSFTYSNSITISGTAGTYEVVIATTDAALNSSSKTISITIKPATTFEIVYAVGDVTWNDWDTSKAMPMTADEDNAGWFELVLYSDGDDDGVKFIGQLDWAPNNWGLVSSADPSKGMVDANNSEKILLDVGYQTIRFNPSTLEYSVTAFSEALPVPNGVFHVMGCGFKQVDGTDIDLCWDPSKAYPMTQDSRNPYLHRLTVAFSDATDLKFNGNQAWDDLDWGFPEAFEDDPNTEDIEEQKLAPAGELLWTSTAKTFGADWKFFDRSGTYELILDEYLGQAQIRKVQ